MDRISVFGLGPVGVVTAVCFTHAGYPVVGIETDTQRVKALNEGTVPFFEPVLSDYLKEAINNGLFRATDESEANSDSRFTFITVGTPSEPDGSISLDYVKSAAKSIGRSLRASRGYQLVLLKSTVTPGTARQVVKPILEKESGKTAGEDFGICSNPEFLREGNAVYDFESPDRIVIGGEGKDIEIAEKFYKEFYEDRLPPIVSTSFETAELIKYASNSFLAMKVSFINMFANLCQNIRGADVEDVAKGIGLDKRIGPLFLQAGLGWGGPCFLKDLRAIASFGKQVNTPTPLVDATINLNNCQPFRAVELAGKLVGNLRGKRIAILGLAFKPDTDDLHEAVSIPIISELLNKEATVVVYDPAANENARRIFGARIEYARDSIACLEQCDCCIIATEWAEFKNLTPEVFLTKMKYAAVVDGRRIYNAQQFENANVNFAATGLGQ